MEEVANLSRHLVTTLELYQLKLIQENWTSLCSGPFTRFTCYNTGVLGPGGCKRSYSGSAQQIHYSRSQGVVTCPWGPPPSFPPQDPPPAAPCQWGLVRVGWGLPATCQGSPGMVVRHSGESTGLDVGRRPLALEGAPPLGDLGPLPPGLNVAAACTRQIKVQSVTCLEPQGLGRL